MRTIASALTTHINSNVTTLALCMRVTRTDNVSTFHTTHQADIEYDGNTYRSNASFTRTNMQQSADFRTDEMEVFGILSVNDILQVDIRAGVFDSAAVYFFYINYNSLSDGIIKLGRGILGNVSVLDGTFRAEVRSLHQKFNRSILRTYTPTCQVDLGSTKCGVDLTNFTWQGQINTISRDREEFTITEQSGSIAQFDTAGFFNGGKIEWTSGDNSGFTSEINLHSSGRVVELFVPAPYSLTAGDQFDIIRGCDKRSITCNTVFDNITNFRGFPEVPGRTLLQDRLPVEE